MNSFRLRKTRVLFSRKLFAFFFLTSFQHVFQSLFIREIPNNSQNPQLMILHFYFPEGFRMEEEFVAA